MKDIPYFHATFLIHGSTHSNCVGKDGHPYKVLNDFLENDYAVQLLSWQEITKEEYEYFWKIRNDLQDSTNFHN